MDITIGIIIELLARDGIDTRQHAAEGAVVRSFARLTENPKPPDSGTLYLCDEASDAECMWLCAAGCGAEELLSHVQAIFLLMHEWYETMQDALLSQQGIQEILTLSEPVIGNFISVSDSALALLAYTKNISTDDPVSLYLIENGHHSNETYRKFVEQKRFKAWTSGNGLIVNDNRTIAKHTVVSRVFTFNRAYFTHVVMSCNNHEISAGLLDLFTIMSKIIDRYVKHEWDAVSFYSQGYNSLVSELVGGKIGDYVDVVERAHIAGLKQGEEYVVLLISEGSTNAAFPGRLARDISEQFFPIRPFYYGTRLLLFLQCKDVRAYLEERGNGKLLTEFFDSHGLHCGISDVFTDLLNMSAAYKQAKLALTANVKKTTVVFFEDVFVKYAFNNDPEMLRLFRNGRYGNMLRALRESDHEKHKNDFDVLKTYLFNERRPAESAEKLFMHRNNVVYRVSKIEELLGISLEDPQTKLNLFLTFLLEDAFHIFD
ncbi:MAG: helix-turn-helix domain-containing protein [Oscillospiraceae bacterium]|nr:helix-turn-helix domain-containing protein [Oscillospiraceae bacterium]